MERKETHRYYKERFPKEGELVLVTYEKLTHFGIMVKLLEYDSIEGMVVFKEISSRSKDLTRSKNQARIGKSDVCVVLYVDEEKQYIDLSRTKVTEEDRVETRRYFQKSKTVESIFSSICKTHNSLTLGYLYENIAWPIQDQLNIHPVEGLALLVDNSDSLSDQDAENKEKIIRLVKFENDQILSDFTDLLNRKFEKKITIMKAVVDVECFHYKGILAIKEALGAAEKKVGVKIRMFNTPSYAIEAKFIGTKGEGEEKIRIAANVIREVISKYDGSCSDYMLFDGFLGRNDSGEESEDEF